MKPCNCDQALELQALLSGSLAEVERLRDERDGALIREDWATEIEATVDRQRGLLEQVLKDWKPGEDILAAIRAELGREAPHCSLCWAASRRATRCSAHGKDDTLPAKEANHAKRA